MSTPLSSAAVPPASPVVRASNWRGTVANHALVLVSGWGACALALPEARHPSLALAGLGAVAVAAALITGWRVLGTLAVVLVAATPLMAGALNQAAASTGRLVLATVLVLLLIVGLDGVERRDPRGPVPVILQVTPPARRWVGPLLAVGSCALLGAVSAATVTPSVALVLVGLLAGVGAVVAATRLH